MEDKIKPIVKWAGGKTQLLGILDKYVPSDYNRYIEPFVGGGALFFHLLQNKRFDEYIINDKCRSLYYLYDILSSKEYDGFIKIIKNLENNYINNGSTKEFYLEIRKKYNALKAQNSNPMLEAVYFLFLNKSCFNGLYRENKHGDFNVPWGNTKNSLGIDYSILDKVNKAFSDGKTKILYGDYYDTLDYIDKNTFIYLDPPYRELNQTSSFNSYNKEGFTDDDQIKLKEFCDTINSKGGKFMLSNSDTEDEFFDTLYCGYNIERVPAKRNINSKGDRRGKINEILIRNY